MSKFYKFICYDEEDKSTTTVEFETDNDAWTGYDGPMMKFHDFLRGCGFVFHHNAVPGIMDDGGEFIGADI